MEDCDVSRPAWKTTVFFLHPDSSCRFRKSPLAVSFTWKLDSDSLGDHSMSSSVPNLMFQSGLFFLCKNFVLAAPSLLHSQTVVQETQCSLHGPNPQCCWLLLSPTLQEMMSLLYYFLAPPKHFCTRIICNSL